MTATNYADIPRNIKTLASLIVFTASTLKGVPYTDTYYVKGLDVFVNVECYETQERETHFLVEVAPDGYVITRKIFNDTAKAVQFLATKLAEVGA